MELTRGFLFCDLRGYTAFVDSHGDRAAAELLDEFRGLVREAIERTGGGEIRTEGDSFYAVFPSASAAIRCGLAILEGAADRKSQRPDRPIDAAVGIHAGEAVDRPDGPVGIAVNIAARVCSVAAAGELLVTDTVRALSRASLDVTFVPRGRRTLKGLAEPIALFAVVDSGRATPGATARARDTRGLITTGRARIAVVSVAAITVLGGAVLVGAAALASGRGAAGSSPSTSTSGHLGSAAASGGSAIATGLTPSAASPSGVENLPGRIGFIGTQVVGGVRQQTYVVDADGTDRRRLTAISPSVQTFGFATDGTRLAFLLDSFTAGPPPIEVGDTSALPGASGLWPGTWRDGMLVAKDGSFDFGDYQGGVDGPSDPAWTPARELILRGARVGGKTPGLLRLSADGYQVSSVITDDPSAGAKVQSPAVSPDGSTIAYVLALGASGASDIWAIATDGSGQAAQITTDIKYAVDPTWSPDGRFLYFAGAESDGMPSRIWVVAAQGGPARQLSSGPGTDAHPSVSPDGRWIAWSHTVDLQRQVWVMAADGSGAHLLLAGEPGENLDRPVWIPAQP
ncbi:MAG TPA: adenylate/guanylate cyclase domain-containing protein [Candidatus Binatia bacterium]|nr:adenylate/guanylate cyclase domain-containing protein [Candidatus Binatia bacterium]